MHFAMAPPIDSLFSECGKQKSAATAIHLTDNHNSDGYCNSGGYCSCDGGSCCNNRNYGDDSCGDNGNCDDLNICDNCYTCCHNNYGNSYDAYKSVYSDNPFDSYYVRDNSNRRQVVCWNWHSLNREQ